MHDPISRQSVRRQAPVMIAGAVLMAALAPQVAAAASNDDSRPASGAGARPSSRASGPALAGRSTLPSGTRYFPAGPLLVGIVQTSAISRFLGMMTGPDKEAGTSDAMAGVFDLLKDQIDGPLSVAAYADPAGKTPAVLITGRLKEASLTQELLNGALSLGGDEGGGAAKTTYRGQTILSMDLAKATGGGTSSLSIQPTFTITTGGDLLIGTTLPAVKGALDVDATGSGGFERRADVASMLREFPLTPATDVWLFVPKPTGKLPFAGKSPIPLPLDALPLGPMVATLRFTPSGVRFEGLASIDRAKTAQAVP